MDKAPPDDPTPEEILFEGRPALLPSLGAALLAVLTLGLALAYFALRRASKRYKITTERVVIETGILSKRMDQIDIYRINDYVVERPFSQRLMGTGNLVLSAMDRSNPELRIEGLKTDVEGLYERLRRATELERRQRNVRLVDYE